MAGIAVWGPKTFEVTSERIYTFFGFSNSRSVASEESKDDAGKPAVNTKGTELEDMSFSLTVSDRVGCPALAEVESWKELVGQYHELFLGSRQWGLYKWQLKQVQLSDVDFDGQGVMRQAKLQFTFKEWVDEPASAKTSSSGGGTASRPAVGPTPADKTQKKRGAGNTPARSE